MQVIKHPKNTDWAKIVERPTARMEDIEKQVAPILEAVKLHGDNAIFDFSKRFDKVDLSELALTEEEISNAQHVLSDALKNAIQQAAQNIRTFHSSQKEEVKVIETMPGVNCWRKSVAIQKVGLYIPGGTAPLFSTVLMLGIPAQIAGCAEVILCSPATNNGTIHPAIIYAANLVGIHKIFKVGGSQAIAAMAYGTESIPKVSKIFGPGNQYVTCAKQLVMKEGIAIDMPAGPSEVLVVADESANPEFIAADLLSQAEHGADSQVIMLTTSQAILEATEVAIAKQLALLPREEMAAKALENSKLILLNTLTEAIAIVNEYAPEHLILAIENAESFAEHIVNAGSVFLGHLTPESAGDYASGTNHTLPTNGFASAYSGVSLDSFVKKITYQRITETGLKNIGAIVEIMAAEEQLMAHKNAVTIRLNSLKN